MSAVKLSRKKAEPVEAKAKKATTPKATKPVLGISVTLKPRMSEKTYASSTATNTFVFDVPLSINKQDIAQAVSAQFSVGVVNVRTTVLKGKVKRTVRRGGRSVTGKRNDVKKAYVTLKVGDSIPVFAAIEEQEKAEAKAAEKAEKKAKKDSK